MFEPGDVVFCPFFPFREDPTKSSPRPALVLAKIKPGIVRIAQITHTDRTGRVPGIMIKENSSTGKSMSLKGDSFVNLGTIADVPEGILKYKGCHPSFKDILKLCTAHHIKLT